MYLVIENDVYKREREIQFTLDEIVTFKFPEPTTFEKHAYDWYTIVALEKSDRVTVDRHLLTRELLLQYRWAIREGYQHQLDPSLRNQYDYPKNKNTVAGIKSYIENIKIKSK